MMKSATRLIFLLLVLSVPSALFGQDVYNEQLNRGLRNNSPYSYLLYKKAEAEPSKRTALIAEASKHSPDVPAYYFKLSWASLSFSPERAYNSIVYLAEGINAYKRSFWWSVSIGGLSLISALLAFLAALFVLIAVRVRLDLELLRHDLREDRKAMIQVFVLAAASLLGPVFFAAGVLFMLGIYMRKPDRLIVYATLLAIALSPFILGLADRFFSLQSPAVKAIVAVNEGRDNSYAIRMLEGRGDFPSRFSYAVALKREGRYEEASGILRELISETEDPRAYVSLGNCFVAMGDMEAAKTLYMKAHEIRPSATALYNLSQIYRAKFDYPKGDEYYVLAKGLDRELVIRYTAISSTNANRLVMDETLTMGELWNYEPPGDRPKLNPFPTGPSFPALAALAMMAVFYFHSRGLKHRAYKCSKCGITLCGRCSKDVLWGNMCHDCYRSVVKPDSKEPKERVSRLLAIYELQSKKRDIIRVLSFLPPGIAHIYAGRLLPGLFLLWAFLFPVLFLLLNPLFSTGLAGFSHGWLALPFVLFIAVLYYLSNSSVRRRLERGWL